MEQEANCCNVEKLLRPAPQLKPAAADPTPLPKTSPKPVSPAGAGLLNRVLVSQPPPTARGTPAAYQILNQGFRKRADYNSHGDDLTGEMVEIEETPPSQDAPATLPTESHTAATIGASRRAGQPNSYPPDVVQELWLR